MTAESKGQGSESKYGYTYSEELIIAVEYLMRRGITRTREIARVLRISPFTVRNIKTILNRRKREEKARKEKKKEKKMLIEVLKKGRQKSKTQEAQS